MSKNIGTHKSSSQTLYQTKKLVETKENEPFAILIYTGGLQATVLMRDTEKC